MVQWIKNNRRNTEKAKQNIAKKKKVQPTVQNFKADEQVLVTEDHNNVSQIDKKPTQVVCSAVDYLEYDEIDDNGVVSNTCDDNEGIQNNENEINSSCSSDNDVIMVYEY